MAPLRQTSNLKRIQEGTPKSKKLLKIAKSDKKGGIISGSVDRKGAETVKSIVRSYAPTTRKDLDKRSADVLEWCSDAGLPCYHNCSDDIFYETTAKGRVCGAMAGTNGTIFTYGQTGSGKTHTMKNIIDRASRDVFSFIASSPDREITITVKHYEIYNEKIFDLSQPSKEISHLSQLRGLKLLKDADGVNQIRGLTEVTVNNVQDIQNVILAGQKNRQVAETKANSHSSRSHAILEVGINNMPKSFSDDAIALKSTLYFVDLAGSESVAGSSTSRHREGTHIKKGLVALSKVIVDILKSNSNRDHVSYRDSMLTRVLEPVLSDNARVVIVYCINPTHVNESKRTLVFARCASQVRTNAKINQVALPAPSSDNEMIHRLENPVDSAPNALNTTSSELLDRNVRLEDELAAKNAELAEKDADIKRLKNSLKSDIMKTSPVTKIGQAGTKQPRYSDTHLFVSSNSSQNAGGNANGDSDMHREALVHKSSVIGGLQIDLERAKGEAKSLRGELGRKDGDIVALANSNQHHLDRIAELEATVAELKSLNADLHSKGDSLRAEKMESEMKVLELLSSEAKLVAEVETLHDKLVASAKQVQELDSQCKKEAHNDMTDATNQDDSGDVPTPPPLPGLVVEATPPTTIPARKPKYKRWYESLDELRDYREANGHCNVPQSQGSLGKWVSTQRSLYRKKENGEHTPLTDDRVAALNAIGFEWDGASAYRASNEELWNEWLDELRDYKEENGDCNVPYRQGPLGKWVRTQRYWYQKRNDGEQTFITDERIIALNAIGFEWKLR